MELQQTIKAECRVSVTMSEDGTLLAKVLASAPYNETGGTATAEVGVPEKYRQVIGNVLGEVLAEVKPQLGDELGRSIHVAREAARRMGE